MSVQKPQTGSVKIHHGQKSEVWGCMISTQTLQQGAKKNWFGTMTLEENMIQLEM